MPAQRKTEFKPDYGTRDDVALRLNGSAVQHKGVLVHCKEIRQEMSSALKILATEMDQLEVQYRRDPTDENHAVYLLANKKYSKAKKAEKTPKLSTICIPYNKYGKQGDAYKADVAELDFSLFHVGFVNSRTRNRHGSTPKTSTQEALYVSRMPYRQTKQGISGQTSTVTNLRGRKDNAFHLEPIARAFYGNYPNLRESIDTLFEMDGTNSIAFHPEFAVQVDETGHTKLYNRTTCVGYCPDAEEGESVFRLHGRYEYLRETLTLINVEIY